ncbi:MAG: VWA domain-containing protein [Alphaproteobacteria bacterium]|nr:VWA domain-containing protein [Alphaproteobacteria bacterium]
MILLLALVGCKNEGGIGYVDPPPVVPNPPAAINPVQIDRIVQVAQPQVDILFIVDDSCSMYEEQTALAQNFPQFMSYFLGSGLDYHIGVTTTDTENPTIAGKLRRAQNQNYIDENTPNPSGVFSGMANAGTGGSVEETGRAAAYQVLQTKRDLPRNEGFYRDEASLHMVFISDEEDQSVSPSLQEWNQWMRNLKWADDMVTSHAITGIPGQECSAIFEPGQLYINYANRTNGVIFNLCSTNWGPLLEELGLQTSGLKREYFLSKIPVTDPWSLQVKVVVDIDGNQVTRRFTSCLAGEEVEDPECDVTYNPGRNSIVFLEYVPDPFSEIYAEYNIRELYQATEQL